MFADAVNAPPTPGFTDRVAPADAAPAQHGFPTLLRQSLLMWERVFAMQDKAVTTGNPHDLAEPVAAATNHA